MENRNRNMRGFSGVGSSFGASTRSGYGVSAPGSNTMSRGQAIRTIGLGAGAIAAAGFGMSGTAKAHGNILYVGPGKPYATIQDAVDDAMPGDKIIIGSGTFDGATIYKNVWITGSGESTVIDNGVDIGTGTLAGLFIPEEIGHAADGSIIENLRIDCSENCGLGVYARDADNVTVSQLTINKTQQGITNRGGSGWKITRNKLMD